MRFFKDSSFLTTLLVSVIIIIFSWKIYSSRQPISWDVFGYYSYLPQTFIYNDPGNKSTVVLDSMRVKYNVSPYLYQVHHLDNGNNPSHYSFGMAILYSPFFFASHIYAKFSNYPTDGFSTPYQYGIIFSYFFYIVLGLFVLRKCLLHFFSSNLVAFIIFLVALGSNFFLTSLVSYGMPHVYLFALTSLVLLFTIKWYANTNFTNSFLLGLFIGVATIARPTAIVNVIIPLLWGINSIKDFKSRPKILFVHKFKFTLICVFTFVIIVFFQLLYWKIYAGKFFYNSYNNPGEGLMLTYPHTWKFLFSFRKGWLIYTPIMIFACFGLISMYKNCKSTTLAIVVFSFVNIYVLSCWSIWWYAASFGSRPMIDSYPVLAFCLASFFLWVNVKRLVKWIVYPFVLLFFVLNLFQSWQFHVGIIDLDRMTKQYYFASFGKTNINPELDSLKYVNRQNYIETNYNEIKRYKSIATMQAANEFKWVKKSSGLWTITNDSLYLKDMRVAFNDLTQQDHVWTKIELSYCYTDSISKGNLLMVYNVLNDKNFAYGYQSIALPDSGKVNTWHSFSVYVLSPYLRIPSDILSVYTYNPFKRNAIIKDLKLTFYERKISYE